MHINLSSDDEISLTLKEITILVALNSGPANAYQLSKNLSMSYGSLYAAVKRLERVNLLALIEPTGHYRNPGKPAKTYAITSTGHMVLEWHIDDLKRLITVHRDNRPAAPRY